MSDQESGAPGAVENPRNDVIVSETQEQVEAVQAPKNEPVEEDHEDEDTDEDNSKDSSDGKKPRRGGFQKKIAKAEAERDFYKAEMERLRSGSPKVENPSPKSEDATLVKPKPDDFQTWDEYTEALTDWKVESKLSQRDAETSKKSQAEKASQTQAERVKAFEAGKEKAREIYEDYDDALAEYDDKPIGAALGRGILESDMSAEVAYYLAKNPDEFARLNAKDMDIVKISKAIGRIEAKLEKSEGEAVAVKVTKAPPPITPVKSRSNGSQKNLEDIDDYDEYKKVRQKQLQR